MKFILIYFEVISKKYWKNAKNCSKTLSFNIDLKVLAKEQCSTFFRCEDNKMFANELIVNKFLENYLFLGKVNFSVRHEISDY